MVLEADIKRHTLWLSSDGKEGCKIDLSFKNLKGINLEKINLTRARIVNSNLMDANLKNAIFVDADLEGTILERANIEGANFQHANLSKVDLTDAIAINTNFEQCILENAFLLNTEFRGANMNGANLNGCNLKDAKNLEITKTARDHTDYSKEMNLHSTENKKDDRDLQIIKAPFLEWRTLPLNAKIKYIGKTEKYSGNGYHLGFGIFLIEIIDSKEKYALVNGKNASVILTRNTEDELIRYFKIIKPFHNMESLEIDIWKTSKYLEVLIINQIVEKFWSIVFSRDSLLPPMYDKFANDLEEFGRTGKNKGLSKQEIYRLNDFSLDVAYLGNGFCGCKVEDEWFIYSFIQSTTILRNPNIEAIIIIITELLPILTDWGQPDAITILKRKGKNYMAALDLLTKLSERKEVQSYLLEDSEGFIKSFKTSIHEISEEQDAGDLIGSKIKSIEEKNDPAVIADYNSALFEKNLELLENLVGLEEVKKEVQNLIKLAKGRMRFKEIGIDTNGHSFHMMFTGSPGTGKTEVARIIASLLHSIGLLESATVVEATRADLVGEYEGSTAKKTKEVIESAMGGVLFIDEAYSLFRGDAFNKNDPFGKEAVDTFIKEMEDHRDQFVVILAGYENDMKRLMTANEGFASRINYTFHFKDYTPEQLYEISIRRLNSNYLLNDEVANKLRDHILKSYNNGDVKGNARWVRTLVEKIEQAHQIRMSEDIEVTNKIELRDIESAVNKYVDPNQSGINELKNEALQELDGLQGLENVKFEIRRVLNLIEYNKKIQEKGLVSQTPNLHMVFSGPPGTGKTTVARLLGKFLKGCSILTNGHFIEVDRSNLVGAYQGHSAKTTQEIIEKALGGVLFIDEAYALCQGSNDTFGKEAIDVLIKEMEDKRSNLVVILAGYENEMETLLKANPGFSSRIGFNFSFPNYSEEDIFEITKKQLEKGMLIVGEKSESILKEAISNAFMINGGSVDGNGRWARNIAEKIRMALANRVMQTNGDDFQTIFPEDILDAFKKS